VPWLKVIVFKKKEKNTRTTKKTLLFTEGQWSTQVIQFPLLCITYIRGLINRVMYLSGGRGRAAQPSPSKHLFSLGLISCFTPSLLAHHHPAGLAVSQGAGGAAHHRGADVPGGCRHFPLPLLKAQ
jgi:hypothetical protein